MNPKNKNLNPFIFPSDTNALFTLLVVSVILWMLELGQIIGVINNPEMTAIAIRFQQDSYTIDQEFINALLSFITPVVFVLVVFLLAIIIYLTHAKRIRIIQRSHPITRNDDPNFFDAIIELFNLSNITSPPSIEIGSDQYSTNGQVFGFWKNYRLRLDKGMRLLFRQDNERFRAIILHESAHIANSDISRTYLTQAIWNSVIVLTIIPTVLLGTRFLLITISNFSTIQTEIFPVLILLIKISCVLIILAGLRRNILQSRELYADYRASTWGANEGLVKILQKNLLVTQKKQLRFWSFHPSSKERLETLQNPNSLFQIKSSLTFFMGVLTGLTTGGFFFAPDFLIATIAIIESIVQNAVGINLPDWSVYLMALGLISPPLMIITILISSCLGIPVQREAIADIAIGKNGLSFYFKLGKQAFLMAIGFQVGNLLTISSMIDLLPTFIKDIKSLLFFSTFVFLVAFLMFLTTWLVLIYLRFFSRRLVGAHAGTSLPKIKIYLLSFVSSFLLTCFYMPIFFVEGIAEGVMSEGNISGVLFILLIVIIITFILYGFIFLATWISLSAYKSFSRSHCSICGHTIKTRYCVGQTCSNCNNELALWLYS